MGAGLPGGRRNGTGRAQQRESRAFLKGSDNWDSLSIGRRVYSKCESLPGPGSSPAIQGLLAIQMVYRLPIKPHTMVAFKHTPPAHHVPDLLDIGAALVLFLETLGHGFPLGCFLSTREHKPESFPSSACCPGAVRVSIASPSSPGLDIHPGEASTACPDLCLMWKQRQKSYINLFSPSGIIFTECTSPLLLFGPAKGPWQAGRAVHPSLHPCSTPGSSSTNICRTWKLFSPCLCHL